MVNKVRLCLVIVLTLIWCLSVAADDHDNSEVQSQQSVDSSDRKEEFKKYFLEAVEARERRDYKTAQTLLQQALTVNPQSPEVYAEICQMADGLGIQAEATIEYCQKALALKSRRSTDIEINRKSAYADFLIYSHLSGAYSKLKYIDDMVVTMEKVLFEECPNSWNPTVNGICPLVKKVTAIDYVRLSLSLYKHTHLREYLDKASAGAREFEALIVDSDDPDVKKTLQEMKTMIRKAKNPWWPF